MSTISISPDDVSSAEDFLETFLGDNIQDGDFSKGTALRDLTVGALAIVYAFFKLQNDKVKARQSLLTIEQGVSDEDTESVDDVVSAILSNFFVTRLPGAKSRGVALGHISSQVDIFIPITTKFLRTPQLTFVPDSTDTLFIAKEDLIPLVNSDNSIIEYQFNIPLVASAVGEAYDIDPGLFSSFDAFNPFVTRIENTSKFNGGKEVETTDEILSRAPTAISVRNLVNDRSITAVLQENFPELKGITVIGMGDPEMQRDRLTGVAEHLAIHVGGAVDVFIKSDLTTTQTSGTVGALFARPDQVINVFRDPTFTATHLFTDTFSSAFINLPVNVGDIIRITAGLPVVPREFDVVEVQATQLLVSERIHFEVATDESSGNVSYTIGNNLARTNVVSNLGLPYTTGVTSRSVVNSGRITMPGLPIMEINDVAITNPTSGDPLINPADGFVHFVKRVNTTPASSDPNALEYQVITHNPLLDQSSQMWTEILVNTGTKNWNGKTLRVTYKTLGDFVNVDTFIRNRFERVVCANILTKGHYPVQLNMTLQYKLKATATGLLDNDAIASEIASFINSFDTSIAPIDTSAVVQHVRDTFTDIAAINPLTINYILSAPDGTTQTYATTDQVVIDNAKLISGNVLDLVGLGITPKTIRYLSDPEVITVTQVS